MNILKLLKTFIFLIVIWFPYQIMAQDELGVYEKLDEYLQDGITLTDDQFQKVDIVAEVKMPTVIAMVYYECPGICTPLMNGLSEVINKSDLELNKDYQIFTISFDHRENTTLARNKKKTYVNLVKHGDAENGWRFFTGDSLMIARFLDNVGYHVKQEGEEYIHPATLLVLSPEGKITRYLHGTYFLPFDLKMAVVEAGLGKSGPTINKVLDFCFSYDPEGKKYVFNTTKISGVVILLAALGFLWFLIRSSKRKETPKIL